MHHFSLEYQWKSLFRDYNGWIEGRSNTLNNFNSCNNSDREEQMLVHIIRQQMCRSKWLYNKKSAHSHIAQCTVLT
jgi:hypothetical protein